MSRLRRLFQRAKLDQMEINILRGVLSAVQKAAGVSGNTKQTQAGSEPTGQEDGHV